MTKTTVVNIRRDPYDVYIGRRGKGQHGYFGNPFSFKPGRSREVMLACYRAWFLLRIDIDAQFRRRVLALRGKRLGCFCAPLSCHGDVIAQWVDAQPEEPPHDRV